jgi:hypothetical protein
MFFLGVKDDWVVYGLLYIGFVNGNGNIPKFVKILTGEKNEVWFERGLALRHSRYIYVPVLITPLVTYNIVSIARRER